MSRAPFPSTSTALPEAPPAKPAAELQAPAKANRHRLVLVPVLLLVAGLVAWALGTRWLPASSAGALTAMGTLEAIEVTVASEVQGRVVDVLVEEGDAVKLGDVLVLLDDAALELQYRMANPTERQLLALQREKYRLRAPREGRVLRRAVQPGEVVVPGAGLLTIGDPARMELTVYVLQRDLGRVQVGAPVAIEAEALPGETFAGSVASVGDKAEFTPRNAQTPKDRLNLVFAVKVRLTTSDGRLKPGMSVAARFMS